MPNDASFPTRRGFLQALGVGVASPVLPTVGGAELGAGSFWFLDVRNGDTWPVDDPVSWSFRNAQQPILDRARDGLLSLTAADGERVVRLVVRRCKLNLLGLARGQVVVHYWGKEGQGDLRPFFRIQGLCRSEVEVFLMDRKRENAILRTGGDFLYGEPLPHDWPCHSFLETYLILQSPTGKTLVEDDDGGDDLNARIVYRATLTGTYRLVTTSLSRTETGEFLLTVQEE